MAEYDPNMMSVLTRLSTVLESIQTSMSVGNVTGGPRAQMGQGSVWNPAVSIASAFGEIPGSIAAVGSLMANGAMGGLARGPNFSGLQFGMQSQEFVANTAAREASLAATLGRVGISGGAGFVAQGLQVLNMFDPSMGRTVDSVMSLFAANSHLTAQGQAAVDQFARMGGARPGSAAYTTQQGLILNEALGRSADGKQITPAYGRSADIRAMTGLLSQRVGGTDKVGMAGALSELVNGMGMQFSDIMGMASANGWDAGQFTSFAAKQWASSQLTGLTGGKFGQAAGMLQSQTGFTGADLLTQAGLANKGYTEIDPVVGQNVQAAMQQVTETAGSVEMQAIQAMAAIDPAGAQQAISRLRAGDMAGARSIINRFRSGKHAAKIGAFGTAAFKNLQGVDKEEVLGLTAGLNASDQLRNYRGQGFVDSIRGMSTERLKAIVEGRDDAGAIGSTDLELSRKMARSVLASRNKGDLKEDTEGANKAFADAGRFLEDSSAKIADIITNGIIKAIQSGDMVKLWESAKQLFTTAMTAGQPPVAVPSKEGQ